jgi:hypothetical protein
MAQQTINIGAAPNDGTGDTARAGGQKINDNFTELYSTFDNTVANGKTGATTLTGYVKGNGTSPFTASATVPTSDLSGSISVANGGTGASSFTATRLLIGDGTSPITTDAGLTFTGGTLTTSGISSKPLSGNGSGAGNEIYGAGANINSSARINNTVIGNSAFINDFLAISDSNVVIGASAGINGAFKSTVIGANALLNAGYAEQSVIIGYGLSVTGGNFMTIVGGGNTVTNGINAVCYGSQNVVSSANQMIGVFGNFNNYLNTHRKGGIFGVGIFSLRDREFGVGFAFGDTGLGFGQSFTGETSPFVPREMGRVAFTWNDPTDATRKATVQYYVRDSAGEREYLKADSDGAGANVTFNGKSYTFATPVKTGGYTVATLPAGTVGMRAYVTDALAPAFLTALVGGGAVNCPAFYNGAAWVAG